MSEIQAAQDDLIAEFELFECLPEWMNTRVFLICTTRPAVPDGRKGFR